MWHTNSRRQHFHTLRQARCRQRNAFVLSCFDLHLESTFASHHSRRQRILEQMLMQPKHLDEVIVIRVRNFLNADMLWYEIDNRLPRSERGSNRSNYFCKELEQPPEFDDSEHHKSPIPDRSTKQSGSRLSRQRPTVRSARPYVASSCCRHLHS